MTPQEQPDIQAGAAYISDNRFNRFDDELIDKYFNDKGKAAIADYAERLAAERVQQFANLLKEASKQTGTVNIDEGLQVFAATLTKRQQLGKEQ